eukprot:m.215483 g.215483  ORF g.215483 m.215483 type:complete len:76 (+) comp13800_c0_seq15:1830-2057(+)
MFVCLLFDKCGLQLSERKEEGTKKTGGATNRRSCSVCYYQSCLFGVCVRSCLHNVFYFAVCSGMADRSVSCAAAG